MKEFWRRWQRLTLGQEITIILIVKLLVIMLLWWLFFADQKVKVDADSILRAADHPIIYHEELK